MRMKVSVSRKPKDDAVVSCKCIKVRERVLRWLLGSQSEIMILIPGSKTTEITIEKSK